MNSMGETVRRYETGVDEITVAVCGNCPVIQPYTTNL